jgi:prophage regulatory protein
VQQVQQHYVSDRQLANHYGVSRATIWRWVAKGILAKPEKLSPGCTRWNLNKIEQSDAERGAAA